MKSFRVTVALLTILLPSTVRAQTQAREGEKAAEPLVADVHVSPYRSTINYSPNFGRGRFDLRDATMLDMIALAYDREAGAIVGGPTWIELDRFDVIAAVSALKPSSPNPDSTTPGNPFSDVRPVLQRVLTERFHLTYHTEHRPLPAYVVTVAKEGAKLTEAKDPAAPNSCQFAQDKAHPGQVAFTCTSTTVSQFLSFFGGVFPHHAIDRTGLTKAYDFSVRLSFEHLQTRDDYIRVYTEAINKQLGLAIVAGDVSQPAIVLDKVDRTPTPNVEEIVKLIPAPPDAEFEVATIKPAADNEPRMMRPLGSQLTLSGYAMQELLVEAWDLPTGAMLANAPPWLDHVRYSILAKLPPDVDARTVFQDRDQTHRMLQKLLVDRFQIKYHWGEQTQDGYVLLPGTPKMKRADPNSRSFCKYGPPEGEKDVRSTQDSPYDHEFHCQNVTMAQFADLVQTLTASEVKNHVRDETGLAGAYDFTLYYTSNRKLRAQTDAATEAAKQAGDATAAPASGVSMVDAFRKQLGLRIERQPRTYPALVLDHIEQTPTEN